MGRWCRQIRVEEVVLWGLCCLIWCLCLYWFCPGTLPFGYLADLKSDRSLVGLLMGLCWSLDDEAVVRIGNCNCFRYLVTYPYYKPLSFGLSELQTLLSAGGDKISKSK